MWGANKQQHDERLNEVLSRIQQCGLRLTKHKCKVGVREVKYLGVILTANGVKPDSSKVDAIENMPKPVDKEGVRRFLGMVQQFSKFMPDLSEVTAPLRQLLGKRVEWHWDIQHDESFAHLKQLLVSSQVLKYYDAKQESILSVDASKSGLGAVLLQQGRPVAFASRAMTDTETRYAQIEKETLAVVFGCDKFHNYLYGKHFKVESDHKPLEIIFRKSLDKAPPRIQRFMLKLQRYDFDLYHVPGKNIPVADALSRAYLPAPNNIKPNMADLQVHSLLASLPVSTDRYVELQHETEKDEVLQRLKQFVMNGWPEHRNMVPVCIQPYWNFREEIHCADGLLFKASSIIIPETMRVDMLAKIHDGHLGIEMCRRRARSVIYWPGMTSAIEKMVKRCSACQRFQTGQTKEPLKPYPIPERPWQQVATDLFQWGGKDYLLLVDRYSGYPEIALLHSTTASSVIKHTKAIFARHGIPEEVLSDNGPQYSSYQYKQFSDEWGFKHVTSSPYYPQSNGLAERCVQTVKKLLKKAFENGDDPYLALLSYRNTSTSKSTSPAEMLMGRKLRTRLPCKASELRPKAINHADVRDSMISRQALMKEHYDQGSKELQPLNPGDRIRVRKADVWVPGTVCDQADTPRSYHIKTEQGGITRRNRRDLMVIPKTTTILPSERPVTDNDLLETPLAEPVRILKPAGNAVSARRVFRTPEGQKTVSQSSGQHYVTRSGREVVKPARYR